jgi:hypothetical protein
MTECNLISYFEKKTEAVLVFYREAANFL